MTVAAMIQLENYDLKSGTPSMTIRQAIDHMVEMNENAIAIVDEDEELAGIITDHDVMRALYKNSTELDEMIVGDWMSVHVKTCSVSAKLADAMRLMGRHKLRHLVVEANETPIAIIGIRALLSRIHENDEMELNVLRDIAIARSA